MYRHYNPNPSELMVDDCAIRALCCLEGMTWEDASLALFMRSYEMKDVQTSSNVFNSYLKNIGYIRTQISNTCPDCYTVHDFCNDNPRGKYVVATQTHVIAVIDGDNYDSWDSSNEPIIYYWSKQRDTLLLFFVERR